MLGRSLSTSSINLSFEEQPQDDSKCEVDSGDELNLNSWQLKR